jgi:hypothetical protein
MIPRQIHDSSAIFRLPDGLRVEDVLSCPEALDACLSGSWTDVGGDEPPVDLTGTADGWAA